MPTTSDRFILTREPVTGKISKGWSFKRAAHGYTLVQHLRSGRAFYGVCDDYGNIQTPPNNWRWRMNTEEIVPFYKTS